MSDIEFEIETKEAKKTGDVFCYSCKSIVDKNAKFCGKCGVAIIKSEQTKFCTNCGKQLEDNVKFCGQCGTGLNKPETEKPFDLDSGKAIEKERKESYVSFFAFCGIVSGIAYFLLMFNGYKSEAYIAFAISVMLVVINHFLKKQR